MHCQRCCIACHQVQYHPLSVQDLKEAVQPLKQANKAWKQVRMAEFEFDLPIPKMPPLPEHYANPRSNRWRVMIYFIATKKIFKVEMWKHALEQYDRYATYDFSRQQYKFSRKNTSMEDLDSDTFLYYLRDMMGKSTLPNSKKHRSVAESKTTGMGHTNYCAEALYILKVPCADAVEINI